MMSLFGSRPRHCYNLTITVLPQLDVQTLLLHRIPFPPFVPTLNLKGWPSLHFTQVPRREYVSSSAH